MTKKTVIIGGGTFYHIRNHLSLAAPAFGTTAKYLHSQFIKHNLPSELHLTKMAGGSTLTTNRDIKILIDNLIKDKNVGTIILNAAICDFNSDWINKEPNGSYAKRLKTSEGNVTLTLSPVEKIINTIRIQRPDIFLVGFKTTTNQNTQEQYYTALKFMKQSKCNLVLANDVITRNNMVLVPEEAKYYNTKNRTRALDGLFKLINMRQNLTYNTTELIKGSNTDLQQTPKTFQKVIKFLIDNGGFISDNGNDFTPGHFCFKLDNNIFLSSQRKADHNKVFENGLTCVSKPKTRVLAIGTKKPSVGATSQKLLFDKFPDYDCIIHTHNPIYSNSKINRILQAPYQCGSIECGKNTVSGIKFHNDIGAVYLDKHGTNIIFKSTDSHKKIIKFIKKNLKLGTKIQ